MENGAIVKQFLTPSKRLGHTVGRVCLKTLYAIGSVTKLLGYVGPLGMSFVTSWGANPKNIETPYPVNC